MYGGIKKQFFFIQVTSIVLNYRTESPPSFVVPSQQAKSGVNESTPTIMAAACCASCVLHCMQINLIPFYQCKAARNMADSNQQCTLVIAAGHATARGNYDNKMAAVCDTTGGFPLFITIIHPHPHTHTHPPPACNQGKELL